MLGKEDYLMIKALHERGVYQKDIAEELGVHPKTVSRALKRQSAPAKGRRQRGSKLDPFKGQVDELLSEGVWNAMVILREIQAAGYEGGRTVLRNYIQPKRALRSGKATVRFETEPGKQLQSDWGQMGTKVAGQPVTVHFLVNTLGYSRRFHFWCTDREDAEHTYEGLIRSLEYFGGVPQTVLVDNLKAAVLDHKAGQPARFNERFVDLAGHYGFTPQACQPRRAQTKGEFVLEVAEKNDVIESPTILASKKNQIAYAEYQMYLDVTDAEITGLVNPDGDELFAPLRYRVLVIQNGNKGIFMEAIWMNDVANRSAVGDEATQSMENALRIILQDFSFLAENQQ